MHSARVAWADARLPAKASMQRETCTEGMRDIDAAA